MERLTVDDMIKALKCISSQDAEGDCYMDHENFKHMEDDKYKRITCGTGENLKDWISGRDAVGCPYHQKTYGTCYEDGELYWLKDVTELLEELKSYKDLEEQGLLVRLPANKNKEIYIISSRWTVCSECGSRFDEYSCIGCEYKCDSKKEHYVLPTYLSSINVSTYANQFGKTIFLTREEAEKKLEEMKAND
nr:MAG TPA: Putative metal uptake regulation protein, Zur, regulatory metal, graded.4A [Caudoviricetes sp.]